MEEIYVVAINYDNMGENPISECVGVYSSVEKAQSKMQEKIKEFQNMKWVLDENYNPNQMVAYLLWEKQDNWNDFIEIVICRKKLDD